MQNNKFLDNVLELETLRRGFALDGRQLQVTCVARQQEIWKIIVNETFKDLSLNLLHLTIIK